jgi:phospholipase/carboxylesterase
MSTIPLEHVYREPDGDSDGQTVVVLHGRGADEQDLLPVAGQLPDGYHVVSLRAPDQLMGGYTWYELDLSGGGLESSQPHPEEFRRSLDAVSESIDGAVEQYGLDPGHIGLLGFSQGAIMTLALLLEAPSHYRWAAAHHGYLADSHADLDPDGIAEKPVFVAAGTADQIIPAGRSEGAADRLRELGADVTFGAYETGHGVGRQELQDLVAFVTAQH